MNPGSISLASIPSLTPQSKPQPSPMTLRFLSNVPFQRGLLTSIPVVITTAWLLPSTVIASFAFLRQFCVAQAGLCL